MLLARGIIILLIYLPTIKSCGITTHTEIAHRASSDYDYLLDNKTSIAQV